VRPHVPAVAERRLGCAWPTDSDGPGLAGQYQERRLEGVLRVLLLAQNLAANAQHHGPMPVRQLRETFLIAPAHEAFQQLFVRQVARASCHSGNSSTVSPLTR
jgi:hypothetical protein